MKTGEGAYLHKGTAGGKKGGKVQGRKREGKQRQRDEPLYDQDRVG